MKSELLEWYARNFIDQFYETVVPEKPNMTKLALDRWAEDGDKLQAIYLRGQRGTVQRGTVQRCAGWTRVSEDVFFRWFDLCVFMTLRGLDPSAFMMYMPSPETSIPFGELVQQMTVISMKSLPTDETRLAVGDVFLRKLWNFVYKWGESRDLRLFCIADEAHRLAYPKSPIGRSSCLYSR